MPLLRPSELARIWELHPKTVYQWIREGRLPAIKTPGAQYRVRAGDVRTYCEEHGLPMPRAIASPAGTVAVIGKAGPSQRALARACRSRGVDVALWPRSLEGLLAVASEVPSLLAIDATSTDLVITDAIRALKKTARTADVPIMVYDAPPRSSALVKVGAASIVPRGKADDAGRALVAMLEEIQEAER